MEPKKGELGCPADSSRGGEGGNVPYYHTFLLLGIVYPITILPGIGGVNNPILLYST